MDPVGQHITVLPEQAQFFLCSLALSECFLQAHNADKTK